MSNYTLMWMGLVVVFVFVLLVPTHRRD